MELEFPRGCFLKCSSNKNLLFSIVLFERIREQEKEPRYGGYTCNLSTLEAKAGELVLDQPGP